MELFFKIRDVMVDVDGGNVIDTASGKVMRFDFVNMTLKPFGCTSKLSPIRFNDNNELMIWFNLRNKWLPLKGTYSTDIVQAVTKLIEIKVDKELLE